MKKRTQIALGTGLVLVVAAGGFAVSSARGADEEETALVAVARGSVIDRASIAG